MTAPRLADVNCTRYKFDPGDRIVVRTRGQVTRDQEKKIRASICKWAGCEVEVLIVNVLVMDLEVLKRGLDHGVVHRKDEGNGSGNGAEVSLRSHEGCSQDSRNGDACDGGSAGDRPQES